MFTKEEIFAMYVNEVPFGNNQFGIEAAARYYFDKSVGSLTLEESATLAGIPQAPSRFNPYRRPEECIKKRNIVLDRMVVEGYITREQFREAIKEPLRLRDRKQVATAPVGAHFVDMVREYLFQKYGEDRVRTSGWDIHTTLDLNYQRNAENAVRESLKGVDKALGYRHYDCSSVFKGSEETSGEILETYFDPSWHMPFQDGLSIRGLVTEVNKKDIRVRVKERYFTLTIENMKWVSRRIKDMNRYFKVGDVPLFKVIQKDLPDQRTNLEDYTDESDAALLAPDDETAETNGEDGKGEPVPEEAVFPFDLELDQEPTIEGGFMVADPRSGDIKALVGGYDYRRSKFNRAIQANRQVGSAFKPIVFGAALDQGYTLSDILFDEPTIFIDQTQFTINERGEIEVRAANPTLARRMRLGLIPKPEPYEPHNFYSSYVGRVTLRGALAGSKNIVSVKLLNSVGYDHVLEYVHKMKLYNRNLQPFPSLALGSMEMTLQDMVFAYSTFANAGIRYEPRFISLIMDSKGRIIEQRPPKGEQLITPQNAFLVTEALKSVIFDAKGTAKRARRLNYPHLAGKTGTTNDFADAWFLGYSPNLVAGAWVGRDKRAMIGRKRTGGNTALPIWLKFFEGVRDDLPREGFEMPEGLIKVPIDKSTGKRMTSDCDCDESALFLETYVRGTEPVDICTKAEQGLVKLPWYLQKRTYQFEDTSGKIKPARVFVDNASQRRAIRFLREVEDDNALNLNQP